MKVRLMAAACAAALLVFGGVSAATAYDRHVKIVNGSSAVLEEFYASTVAQKSWQEDILGDDVIEPGDSWNIRIDDGSGYCLYDFRAVFDDGSTAEKHKVNVCEVSVFTFTD